jgi:hypothetical protein
VILPAFRVRARLAPGQTLLGLQQSMHHQQLAHQVIQGLAGAFPVGIAQRPSKERVSLLTLLRSHPPRVGHPCPLDRLARRCCQVVVRVVADDLDDLDEAERSPHPAQGRALVIVDLGHATMMPPSWLGHRVAALAGAVRDSIYI